MKFIMYNSNGISFIFKTNVLKDVRLRKAARSSLKPYEPRRAYT